MHVPSLGRAPAALPTCLAVGQDTTGTSVPADFDTFRLKADAEELHLPVILRQQNP
jgi:hypothetical protein